LFKAIASLERKKRLLQIYDKMAPKS